MLSGRAMKTIILGLGNTILTDDGAGIYVARLLEKRLAAGKQQPVTVCEASIGGFSFIDILTGYDKAVIIDAIHSKNGSPGEFYELDMKCLRPSARISSLHGIDLATACEIARKMEIPFPDEIKIFVMEVRDEFTFGERCTPPVETTIPVMAEEIYKQLQNEKWI